MYLKLISWLMIGLWGAILMPLPRAIAATPLTRAEIQNLRNLVQLLPRKNKKRPARKLDPIIPGDGLSTGRSSLVDLRFNDSSLARVGERAVFQFLPKTRNFRLSNGTVLLLIPPGRGQTRIQTPSAAAAIRGSALFVRYDNQTDTTIVGALTNSGIEVFNQEASQNQVLEAGQLMVIVKGEFQGLYDFDLRNFYETSDLVQGLDLTKQNSTSNPDPAIASIQSEIATALAAQQPIVGQGVMENPSFLELSVNSSNLVEQGLILDNSPVDILVETGEVLFDSVQQSTNPEDIINLPTQPPVNSPPIDPPPIDPPPIDPPPIDPPPIDPPPIDPPPIDPPPIDPPPIDPPPIDPPPIDPPPIDPPPIDPPPIDPPPIDPPPIDPPPVFPSP
ncbi:FecR domain-containing protein [Fortiea sp. LEGE XX443]|uniref:FecR family protein n=1 Tax=Fortiea sp. LEGE XX443 TaxID=1828611 RepID=UPI00187E3F65|nr:FecR family protein [Fortiea sp. LEGE XX443]MBE9004616.1 FecR domain-containing protein [Fortiea sp. LEGE XX443]